MSVNPQRALRGCVLVAWAAFFGWLWLTGERTRYLGPRTYWVVTFGALALGLAALAHVATLRRGRRAVPSFGEVAGALTLLAPILAVAVVPSAELGALAASRKATSNAVAPGTIPPGAPREGAPSFIDIHYAGQSEAYARTVGVTEGRRVSLVGFVAEDSEAPEGTFALTRFYVSCCAADAIPYSVAVDPGMSALTPPDDAWVRVEGELERRDAQYVLTALRLERVPLPEDPYLY